VVNCLTRGAFPVEGSLYIRRENADEHPTEMPVSGPATFRTNTNMVERANLRERLHYKVF